VTDPEKLIGKRFVTDLRVVAVAPGAPDDDERMVTVHLHGDRAQLALRELAAMIDAGFLVEVPERG
jgi:hypothetical protein